MKDRLRHVPWWRWLLVPVAVASVVYVGIDKDFTAAILAVVAILAAVFAVWNPFEAKPKPHLTLRPVDGEEKTSLRLGVDWHAVDVDAVAENAREAAMAATPQSGMLMMGKYAEPTQADHEKYEADVEAYAEEVRAWALEAEGRLRERALVLEAEVIQHNPRSVDADDAEVFVTFPAGTEEFDDEDDPPEAPKSPSFPLRLSPAGQMLMGRSPLTAGVRGMRGGASAMRGAFPVDKKRVLESLSDLQEKASWSYPRFTQERDGTLKLSYRSQTIRHRQDVPSGDPFRVRLPAGEHEVRWEVFVRNLPRSLKGVWKLSCPAEPSREPIDNVYDLEAALRGEPIPTPADRAALLRALIDESKSE